MQWSGKVPPNGLTPAKRERKAQEQVAARVLDALAGDPAFQVRTVDGRHWICPYTGALVPCAAGSLDAARQYLFQRQPWTLRRGGKPRALFLVLVQKWTLHLDGAPDDTRCRTFDAEGRWQHPDTKAWTLLPRARSAADPHAVEDIAHALAAAP